MASLTIPNIELLHTTNQGRRGFVFWRRASGGGLVGSGWRHIIHTLTHTPLHTIVRY